MMIPEKGASRGVAASKPLPLGRYKIIEVTAPPYWKISGTAFDETLEYPGQIIKVSAYDLRDLLARLGGDGVEVEGIAVGTGQIGGQHLIVAAGAGLVKDLF